MFGHLFFYRLKVIFHNKVILFWTLIFPIALATFFNLAFANLASDEVFKPANIAFVEGKETEQKKSFLEVVDSLSKEDKNQLFKLSILTEEQAKEQLLNNKISGYFKVGEQIEVVIKENGVDQTVMKSVVDQYNQVVSITNHLLEYQPEAIKKGVLAELDKEHTYFKDQSTSNIDFTVIYFYTLIGMVCMYGGYFGIDAVNETEANLSKRGARISVSPTHKLKTLLVFLLAGFLFQYVEMLLVFAYLILGLGIDFGNQLVPILGLAFVGSFAGMVVGTLIGASNRKSDNTKVAILTSTSLFCSFLAGMMVWQMKYIIATYAPIINWINPVAVITDALYSLYYYGLTSRYWLDLGILGIFIVIMVGLSYYFVRRKKYDSI